MTLQAANAQSVDGVEARLVDGVWQSEDDGFAERLNAAEKEMYANLTIATGEASPDMRATRRRYYKRNVPSLLTID